MPIDERRKTVSEPNVWLFVRASAPKTHQITYKFSSNGMRVSNTYYVGMVEVWLRLIGYRRTVSHRQQNTHKQANMNWQNYFRLDLLCRSFVCLFMLEHFIVYCCCSECFFVVVAVFSALFFLEVRWSFLLC